MLINPLPQHDIHAEGNTGSKTDQMNNNKKHVTTTIKNKDTTTGTRSPETEVAAVLEDMPRQIPQHVDPTPISFTDTAPSVSGNKTSDYMDLRCGHFCVLKTTLNLLDWEVLLQYVPQNQIHLFDKLGKY